MEVIWHLNLLPMMLVRLGKYMVNPPSIKNAIFRLKKAIFGQKISFYSYCFSRKCNFLLLKNLKNLGPRIRPYEPSPKNCEPCNNGLENLFGDENSSK
jgi:hypothetical protein